MAGEARRHPRSVGLEERFATLLPDVLIGLGLRGVRRRWRRKALEPKPEPELIGLAHIHAPDGERARAGHRGGRAAAAAAAR